MRVSVIISNRNDVAMLAVTLRSAIEELSAVPGDGEVVICDNSDTQYRDAVKSIIPRRYFGNTVRLYYQDYPCLFTARETAARKARGEYIICVDSHMLFGHDSIINAVHFMNRRRRQPIGFGSLPINWLCQHEAAARHDMRHLYGTWGSHYEYERRITWKGMPWICRREWFLKRLGAYGCLSANKMAWGGGDMYLGVKSWLLGFENWAIPSRPVIHIGPLPTAARDFYNYRVYSGSGEQFPTLGFIMAFYALGVNESYFERPEISDFLTKRVGANFREHLPLARALAATDRRNIAKRAVMTYDQLEKASPWDEGIEYKPFYEKFRAKFNTAKSIFVSFCKIDGQLLQRLVRQYNVKTVLEFGSGLSTILFDRLNLIVTSFETDAEYMADVDRMCAGNITFYTWDNQHLPIKLPAVDMAFVDGADPRQRQINLAAESTRVMVIHDGYTRPTPKVIENCLFDWREIKVNSRRARLFIKKD